MRSLALDVGDKTDAATVFLQSRVVKTLLRRQSDTGVGHGILRFQLNRFELLFFCNVTNERFHVTGSVPSGLVPVETGFCTTAAFASLPISSPSAASGGGRRREESLASRSSAKTCAPPGQAQWRRVRGLPCSCIDPVSVLLLHFILYVTEESLLLAPLPDASSACFPFRSAPLIGSTVTALLLRKSRKHSVVVPNSLPRR